MNSFYRRSLVAAAGGGEMAEELDAAPEGGYGGAIVAADMPPDYPVQNLLGLFDSPSVHSRGFDVPPAKVRITNPEYEDEDA